MRQVFKITVGDLPIFVDQHGGKSKLFRVTYWKQVKSNLTYAEAAHELGECIFHALACDSKLDNDGE